MLLFANVAMPDTLSLKKDLANIAQPLPVIRNTFAELWQ